MSEPRSPMNSPAFRVAAVAVLAAITTLLTRVVQVPTFAGNYINFSDVAVVFTAVIFGPFTAAIAGGAGTALADLLSPYAVWAPFTLVVHGAQGLVIGLIAAARPGNRVVAVLSALAGMAIMVAGYFVAGAILAGFAASLSGVFLNAVQGAVGVVLGLLAAVAVDRAYPPVRQWKW
jgi:uncharacterized membrane protein